MLANKSPLKLSIVAMRIFDLGQKYAKYGVIYRNTQMYSYTYNNIFFLFLYFLESGRGSAFKWFNVHITQIA